jgi:HSP20 family protein
MLPMLRKSGMPSFFEDFFGKDLIPDLFPEENRRFTTPSVNIVEEKEDFRIELAVPGLDKKDIKIDLDNNVLTISSEKEEKKEDEDNKVMRREFRYASFTRSFTLPDVADYEKINASHSNGILTITIPKKEEAKVKPSRQIKIS